MLVGLTIAIFYSVATVAIAGIDVVVVVAVASVVCGACELMHFV